MTTESMSPPQDQEEPIQYTLEIIIDEEGMRVSWDENINTEYNYLSKMEKEELDKTLIDIVKDLLEEFTKEENVVTTETEEE